MNEHLEIKLKPQLSDMLTSPDLVKVEVPYLTTNIDLFTPVNTQMSNSKMSTQVHDDNSKPKIMKYQHISASHWLLNYKKQSTKKSTYTCQRCSHISQPSNNYTSQKQRQRGSNQVYFHHIVLVRIHLGWIDPYSMQRYCSKLRTIYRFLYSTLSHKQQL